MANSNSTSQPSDKTIFLAAIARETAFERAAYLDAACANDPVQRQRIEQLLANHFGEDPFMEAPAIDVAAEGLSRVPWREGPGTLIGRYKLLEKIGEGGMGVVYMAEQEEPVRRRVALKIIKLGMDTKQVVARFEAERQALALMDHPHIAKVLDGGATDTGRPYFVMDLVQGVPVTEFCDKNRLSAQERIKLFITVCQAIQSAHQKGIIHRDLKPTNILVTLNAGVPHPMVIDFGVAKATNQKLTEKTVFTNYAAMIGTPAYMSPEQAEMSRLDVDTRSDIYGLGVLFYELLTGTTPFPDQRLRSAGYREMQRIIMEEEPERPSTRLTRKLVAASRQSAADSGVEAGGALPRRRYGQIEELVRLLRGDLDWIVMKCLEKDRARRPETANGLAMDLQRHLSDEPVVARPPSGAYRARKFIHRNRVTVTATAVVGAVLVLGSFVSTWQALRATQAKREQSRLREAAQTAQANEAEQRRRAEQQLYAAKMNLAGQAWEQNNIGRLRQLLEETQGYPDRGFEWYSWQPKTHLALKTLRGHLNAVESAAFSRDGRRIATGSWDGTAKVWDAATGTELVALKGHSNAVRSVAFSPDGQHVVTGGDDRTAIVWEAVSGLSADNIGGNCLTLHGHSGSVLCVAFSRDGQRMVTSGGDGDRTAKVWEAASGREQFSLVGHSNGIWSVAFSRDGQRIVTGSHDHTAKVWAAASGNELLTLSGHTGPVCSAAFSPDGQRIITGSHDHTARVWEAASGKALFTITGHTETVSSAAFSPDGQRIVTGSWDGTAKVWGAASGNLLRTLKGHADAVTSAAFSPDGQRVVTTSFDQTAKVWEMATVQQVDAWQREEKGAAERLAVLRQQREREERRE